MLRETLSRSRKKQDYIIGRVKTVKAAFLWCCDCSHVPPHNHQGAWLSTVLIQIILDNYVMSEYPP